MTAVLADIDGEDNSVHVSMAVRGEAQADLAKW